MAKSFGVDVSEWNGIINWKLLKQEGVKFAVIRAGFGSSVSQIDKHFKRNIAEAYKQGITIGVYWFGYCHTVENARLEADTCHKIIKSYKKYLTLPVFFDWEYDSYDYVAGIKTGIKLCTPTKKLVTDMTIAFMNRMQELGYKTGFYANPDYLRNWYDYSRVKSYNLWIAQWGEARPDPSKYNYVIHQYTEHGKLKGNGSEDIDLNYIYSNDFSIGSGEVTPAAEYHPRLSSNDSYWGNMLDPSSKAYKYFSHTSAGGKNECIVISPSIGAPFSGYCLPNCVGYAWGRAYELLGKRPDLSKNSARRWYDYNKSRNAFNFGPDPQLGSIMCADHPEGGHVAVVEKIISDTEIVTSESGYPTASSPNGYVFKTVNRRKVNGSWSWGTYKVQGFIYLDDFTDLPSREWIARDDTNGTNPLNQEEKENNAILFARFFLDKGWTLQAIAGMLGNIAGEGVFNPGQWEYGTKLYGTFPDELPDADKNFDGIDDYTGKILRRAGYGLVGWTPYTKYAHWVLKTYGDDAQWRRDGDYQCAFIHHEMESETQYRYAYDSSYGKYTELKTFRGFSQSVLDPYLLGRCFMRSYERAGDMSEGAVHRRGLNAKTWYKFLVENTDELYTVPLPYIYSCEQVNAKKLIVSGSPGGKESLTRSVKLYYKWGNAKIDPAKKDTYDGMFNLTLNKDFELTITKRRLAKGVTLLLVQDNGGGFPEQSTTLVVELTPSYPCVYLSNSKGEFVPYVPFLKDKNGVNMYVPVINLEGAYYAIYNTDIEKISK